MFCRCRSRRGQSTPRCDAQLSTQTERERERDSGSSGRISLNRSHSCSAPPVSSIRPFGRGKEKTNWAVAPRAILSRGDQFVLHSSLALRAVCALRFARPLPWSEVRGGGGRRSLPLPRSPLRSFLCRVNLWILYNCESAGDFVCRPTIASPVAHSSRALKGCFEIRGVLTASVIFLRKNPKEPRSGLRRSGGWL